MIITCASCLTKYNLDDSRISTKGAKVRCSRCKHVFYVVPPPETKEEILEDVDSFAKFHEGLMEPEEKEPAPKVSEVSEEKEKPLEGERRFISSEEIQLKEEGLPKKPEEEEKVEQKIIAPRRVVEEEKPALRESRASFRFFALIVVLIILIFIMFYLWTELESGGSLSNYLEIMIKKITDLWYQILGS